MKFISNIVDADVPLFVCTPRMNTTNNVVLSCTPWIGNQEKYIQRLKMRQQSGHSALKTMYRHSPQTDEKLQLILEFNFHNLPI